MNTLYNNNVDGALKLITVNGHTYQLGKDASASEGGISKLYGSFETYKAATDGSYDAKTVYDEISGIKEILGDNSSSVSDQIEAINDLIGTVAENHTVMGDVAAAQAAADAAQADIDAYEAANDAKIGTVTSGKTVVEMISDAEAAAKSYADGLDTAMDGRMDAAEAAINTLNGDSSTAGSVAKAVSDAVASIIDGAPQTMDTLKEVSDWIENDQTGAAAMIADIASLQSGKKDKQTAVTNIAGAGDETIATLTQNANGDISYTMKKIQDASASQHGLMSAAQYSKVEAISASVANDTLTIVTAA